MGNADTGGDTGVLQVFILRDGRFWGSECFVQRRITIGTSPDADLTLPGDDISLIHASLLLSRDGLVLADEDSSTGVRLNGEWIDSALVASKDEIVIGPFVLKVKQLESAHKQAPKKITAVTEVRRIPRGPHLEITEAAAPPGAPAAPETEAAQVESLEAPEATDGPLAPEDWSEYDEWDEQDPTDWVEPFSMLDHLVREDFSGEPVEIDKTPVVELIRYTSSRQVTDYEQIAPGDLQPLGSHRYAQVRHDEAGSCTLTFTDEFSGGVIAAGQTVPLEQLKLTTDRRGIRRGQTVYAHSLIEGDFANLTHPGGGTFVRFVNPPKVPRPKLRLRPDPTVWKIFGATFAGHLLLLAAIGLLLPGPDAVASQDPYEFARYTVPMEPPDVEPPPPQTKPTPVVEIQEAPPAPVAKPEPAEPNHRPAKTKGVRRPGKARAGQGGGPGMKQLLAQLDNSRADKIVADVTNVEGVETRGVKTRYKLSGAMVKLPTKDVLTGGDRGKGFKAARELLASGNGDKSGFGPGKLKPGVIGGRKVGALVLGKAPGHRDYIKGKAYLTKQQIDRVVRRHRKAIEYCYERNLLAKPGLKGTLRIGWTVATTGRVTVVRTISDTFPTPAVNLCVARVVKSMRFPKPKGKVQVTYPFMFMPIGF